MIVAIPFATVVTVADMLFPTKFSVLILPEVPVGLFSSWISIPPNAPVPALTSPQTGTVPLKRRTLPVAPGLITNDVTPVLLW